MHRGRVRSALLRAAAFCVAAAVLLAAPAAAIEPEAEQAASTFLRAVLGGDRATALRLTPTQPDNRFGPPAFARMPTLHSARVDAHRAVVLFTGPAADPAQPGKGAIVLTMLDDVAGNPWRVRQVAFFDKPPLGLRIPSRSVTRRDQAQEPAAIEAARRYVAAWLKGDYATMEALAFDWVSRVRERDYSVNIRSIEFDGENARGGEIRLNFTARVTFYRVLPRTITGTVFALREDGRWKIRSNELTL